MPSTRLSSLEKLKVWDEDAGTAIETSRGNRKIREKSVVC